MIIRTGGILLRNLHFLYSGEKVEIVSRFTYLGVVLLLESILDAFETLAGQWGKRYSNYTNIENNLHHYQQSMF